MKIPVLAAEIKALFYPSLCAACSGPLSGTELFICTRCNLHLPRTGYNPTDAHALKKLFDGRLRLTQAHAWLFFRREGITRQLMHSLKYAGNQQLPFYLGRLYAAELKHHPDFIKPDFLFTVPMHPDKLRKRGYNQSEQIALGFSQESGIPFIQGVLKRKANNASQTRKKRYERWENSEGIFVKDPSFDKILKGHAACIDDVVTTGSTAEACCLALEGSGIDAFSVFSLCTAVN